MSRTPNRSPSQWKELIAQWQRSGLSVRAFALENGIKRSTFAYHKKRFEQAEPLSFVPVRKIASTPTEHLEVFLPSGLRLRWPVEVQPERVAALMVALEGRS